MALDVRDYHSIVVSPHSIDYAVEDGLITRRHTIVGVELVPNSQIGYETVFIYGVPKKYNYLKTVAHVNGSDINDYVKRGWQIVEFHSDGSCTLREEIEDNFE